MAAKKNAVVTKELNELTTSVTKFINEQVKNGVTDKKKVKAFIERATEDVLENKIDSYLSSVQFNEMAMPLIEKAVEKELKAALPALAKHFVKNCYIINE